MLTNKIEAKYSLKLKTQTTFQTEKNIFIFFYQKLNTLLNHLIAKQYRTE